MAKGYGISVFIVGHVTKEGVVAGPRVLEHMVDTVLYFEGDRHASYRILRGVKNRFGSTNEIGVFEMQNDGLREVENPSEYMLKGRPVDASGTVTSCSVEGTRPILLEIQSLLCKTNFGIPRRTTVGTDYNRVNLILAVLEKKAGLKLYEYEDQTSDIAQRTIANAKGDHSFHLMDSTESATANTYAAVTEDGKFLMLFTDSSSNDEPSDKKSSAAKAVESFK